MISAFPQKMRWRRPYVASDGELWTLQLDARGDLYHTDTPAPLPSDSHFIARGLPYAALDWRWPFISSGANGKSFIVEPIAQLIAAPYGGNQTNIPNEDSLNLEIDDNNIFSFDQVPGYDLAETGPRANFGVRAESRFAFGYVEGLVGQTFRLKSRPGLLRRARGSRVPPPTLSVASALSFRHIWTLPTASTSTKGPARCDEMKFTLPGSTAVPAPRSAIYNWRQQCTR